MPYVNKKAGILEKNIKQVISSSYYSAKPRVIFLSSPMIRPGGKDPISKYKQSMVVYQFNCSCEDSYIGMTSRQFGKRIKEHVPKSIEEFYKMNLKESKFVRVVNAFKELL